MAPSSRVVPNYEQGEKCLCFHGPTLYDAKIIEVEQDDPKDRKSAWNYFVHYQGWKNTWDDWVKEDRLRKANSENIELKKQQHAAQKNAQREATETKNSKKALMFPDKMKRKSGAHDLSSARASEDRSSSVQAPPPRGTKRARDWEIEKVNSLMPRQPDMAAKLEKEENFLAKPAIRIPLPDNLKSYLVDDWENVTKNLTLVPTPHPHSVTEILSDYTSAEAPRRRPGSAEADVLEEIVQGVRDYFDRCLGRILLYRYEKPQWHEIYEAFNKDSNDASATLRVAIPSEDGTEEETFEANLAGKTACDVYGPEHLCRLFVSMPELIAQTNMDPQAVNKLREELSRMTSWLGRNANKYFAKQYVDPGEKYKQTAKGMP